MDEATRRDLLSGRVEPGGRSPAPFPLRTVQEFVNTWNHELPSEWDGLGSVESARAWLRDHRLLAPSEALSERDRRKLILLRESLRALLVAKQGLSLSPQTLKDLNDLTEPIQGSLPRKGRLVSSTIERGY